jgi:hypothetical protein
MSWRQLWDGVTGSRQAGPPLTPAVDSHHTTRSISIHARLQLLSLIANSIHALTYSKFVMGWSTVPFIKIVKTCVITPHISSNRLSSQQLHVSFFSLLIILHPSPSQTTACTKASDEKSVTCQGVRVQDLL